MTMPTPDNQGPLRGRFVSKRLMHRGACGTWHEAASSASLNSAMLPTEFAASGSGGSHHRILVAREPTPGEVMGADPVGIIHRHLAEVTDAAWMTDNAERRLFVQVTSCEPRGVASQLASDQVVSQWRHIVAAVASALAHLHALGLAHGAVHSNNIFKQGDTWRLGPSLCSRSICAADDLQALASLIGTELRRPIADPHEEPLLARLSEVCMIKGVGAAHIAVWAETGIPATLPLPQRQIPPMPKVERMTDGFRLSSESGQAMVFLTCEPHRVPQAGSFIPISQIDQVGVFLASSTPGQAEMVIPRKTTVVLCADIVDGVAVVGAHTLVDPLRDWGNLHVIMRQEGIVLRWFWPKDMTCRTVCIQVRPDRYPGPSDDQDVQALHRTQYDESGQCLIAGSPNWKCAFVRVSRADIDSTHVDNAVYGNATRMSSDPRTTTSLGAAARPWHWWRRGVTAQRLSPLHSSLAVLCGTALLGTAFCIACWFHGRSPASLNTPAISTVAPIAAANEPIRTPSPLAPRPSPGTSVLVEHSQATPSAVEGGLQGLPQIVPLDTEPAPVSRTASAGPITASSPNEPNQVPTPPAPPVRDTIALSKPPQRQSPVNGEDAPPLSAGASSEPVAAPFASPASLPSSVALRSDSVITPETAEHMPAATTESPSKDVFVVSAGPLHPRPPAIQYVNLPPAAVALTAILSTHDTSGGTANQKQVISLSVNSTTHTTYITPLPEGFSNRTIAAGDLRIVVTYADGQSLVHRCTKPKYLRAGDTLVEDVKNIIAPPMLKGAAIQLVGIPATTQNLQAFVRIHAARTGAVSEVYIPIRGGDNVAQITQVGSMPAGIGNAIQPADLRVVVMLADGRTLSYRNAVLIPVSAAKVSILDLSSITPTALAVPARIAPARPIHVNWAELAGTPPRYGTSPALRSPTR